MPKWGSNKWGAPLTGGGGGLVPMYFGGIQSVVGNKMRTNGISNATTFNTFDTGSERPMPVAGTIDKVVISRNRTVDNSTFTISVNGSTVGTVQILIGVAVQEFEDLGIAVAAMGRVAIGITIGNSDLVVADVYWVPS